MIARKNPWHSHKLYANISLHLNNSTTDEGLLTLRSGGQLLSLTPPGISPGYE
jgi:hypothetical protein